MKTTLISFESLFFHHPSTAIDIIKEEISKKAGKEYDTVIGSILVEIIPSNEILNLVEALVEIKRYSLSLGFSNFKLILMPPYKQYSEELRGFDIYWYDYLARITHNAYLTRPERLSTQWNRQSGKILVVTGIPHRYNRIRLLYKLYQENLLDDDKCLWSFFKPFSEESWNECRRFLNDIDDTEFDKFMSYAVRTLDDVKVIGAKFAAQTIVDDFSLPLELYSETCLSLIPEAHCYPDQPKYDISERTWRVIINRHPFLIAGTQGNTDYLKSLGYKTFEEYFPLRYDDTDDLEQTLNNIVENTKHFLSIMSSRADEIEEDVEHNYNNFIKMLGESDQLKDDLKNSFGAEDNELDEIFNTTNYWNLGGTSFLEPLDQKQIKNKNQ
jgi:hypothetical protein